MSWSPQKRPTAVSMASFDLVDCELRRRRQVAERKAGVDQVVEWIVGGLVERYGERGALFYVVGSLSCEYPEAAARLKKALNRGGV